MGIKKGYDMKRAVLIIFAGMLAAGILFFSLWKSGGFGEPENYRFILRSDGTGEGLPEMIPGRIRLIPFAFAFNTPVRAVRLEIADEEIRAMGVSIDGGEVPVVGGWASSKARFLIKEGTKPWRFSLVILARDPESGGILGKGEIPFAVYPYFYNLRLCSC